MKKIILTLLLGVSGCALVASPSGELAERSDIAREGAAYKLPLSQRNLPDLAADASLPNIMQYAMEANGELESAYFSWASSIERVVAAGALPDPKIKLTVFSAKENYSTVNAFIDALSLMAEQELPAEAKRSKDAEIALLEAKAAGERFRAARSRIYRESVEAYSALRALKEFSEESNVTLSLLLKSQDLSTHRFHAGTATALVDIRKLQVEIENERTELRRLENEERKSLAKLNQLLSRSPDAAFGPLDAIHDPIPIQPEEELQKLIQLRNPGYQEMLKEREAGAQMVSRAELERYPNYGVLAGIDDMLVPLFGASISVPINRERINAGIREAEAARESRTAQLRQSEADLFAQLAIVLANIHDAERVITDVSKRILPQTEELLELQEGEYASGEGEILEILDTKRTLSTLRRLLISARAERESNYGALSELTASDLLGLFPAGKTETSLQPESTP